MKFFVKEIIPGVKFKVGFGIDLLRVWFDVFSTGDSSVEIRSRYWFGIGPTDRTGTWVRWIGFLFAFGHGQSELFE